MKYHSQSLYKISFLETLSNIVYIAHIANNKCNVMVFSELITFLEKNYLFRKKNCKIIY